MPEAISKLDLGAFAERAGWLRPAISKDGPEENLRIV
jgi:hypothetical protein